MGHSKMTINGNAVQSQLNFGFGLFILFLEPFLKVIRFKNGKNSFQKPSDQNSASIRYCVHDVKCPF